MKVEHTIEFQCGKSILVRCYGCKHIILHCELNSKEFAKSEFVMEKNIHFSTSNGTSSKGDFFYKGCPRPEFNFKMLYTN